VWLSDKQKKWYIGPQADKVIIVDSPARAVKEDKEEKWK
jgi:hypothetical protein